MFASRRSLKLLRTGMELWSLRWSPLKASFVFHRPCFPLSILEGSSSSVGWFKISLSQFSGRSGTFLIDSGVPILVSTESSSPSGGDASFNFSSSGTNAFTMKPSTRQGSRPALVKFTLRHSSLPVALSSRRLFSSNLISFSGQLARRRTERLTTFRVPSVRTRNVNL